MTSAILALGGNGMVGKRLLPLLQSSSTNVRSAGRSQNADVQFDWSAERNDEALFTGIDALYLVPPALVHDPVDRVTPFLAAARQAGVRKVVAISSLGVKLPTEPALSPRHRLEQAIVGSGMEWTILRPSGFMQNFSEGFVMPMIRAGVVVAAADEGKVAFVDALDIAAVAAIALTRSDLEGKYLELTGPELLSFRAITASIAETAGREIVYQPVDESKMRELMISGGVPVDYVEILLRDQRAIREGTAAVVTDTISSVLDRPARNFASFLRDAAPVWR